MNTAKMKIGNLAIGDDRNFFLIAGPCVIESEEMCVRIAETLVKQTSHKDIPYIFKASFDKANRSSISSFRGPGMEQGLRVLRRIREQFDIPVTTDIHCTSQVAAVNDAVDILQIPAFLCRQTDLLLAAAKTGKPINVKKGQFLSPWDARNIVEKIRSAGNESVLLTERGTFFGYNKLVVDFRSIPVMKDFGCPVVFDATHSVQEPGGGGTVSGGNREFVPGLARAAMAAGADGIFLEVHPRPEDALSDGPNMLTLDSLPPLLSILTEIHALLADKK